MHTFNLKTALRNILKACEYLIAPLTVFGLFAVCAALNGLYPFGDKSIAWCDMVQQAVPLLCDFKDILSGKHGTFLSAVNAGGMNFYGVYLFNLSSPFTFLVAFVDKADMQDFCNVLVMFKMMTAGLTAQIYFRRKLQFSRLPLVLALSVTYAFSGYVLMYYQTLAWLDVVYIFPLLLLGLERLRAGKGVTLYVITLSLCVVFHFYISYMVVLYCILYASVTAFLSGDKKFALKFVFGSAVAAIICAVVYIPVLLQYVGSARTGSVIGSLMNSSGVTNYVTVLPTVFCLAAAVPLFFVKKPSVNAKILAIMLVLTLVPLILEPVNKMWHTGSYMAFPSRYGFMTVFTGLALAAENYAEKSAATLGVQADANGGKSILKKPYVSVLIGLAVIICAVWIVKAAYDYACRDTETLSRFSRTLWGDDASFRAILPVYIGIAAFAVVLRLLVKYGWLKNTFFGIAMFVLACNEAFFGMRVYMAVPADVGVAENRSERYRAVMELENVIEDDGFYRIKTYNKITDVNTVGALGYANLGHYTSLNGENYMKMVKQFGYSSYWMEVGAYGGTRFSDALFCNKYELRSGKRKGAVYSTDKYSFMEKQYFMPLGIVLKGDFITDMQGERSDALEQSFKTLTGSEGLVKKYEYSAIKGASDLSEGNAYRFTPDGSGEGTIEYSIKITEPQQLYFDCFYLYGNALNQPVNKSFKVKVNNSVVAYEYPTKSSNGFLDLGHFDSGTVKVQLTLLKDLYCTSFGVFGEITDKLESAVESAVSANMKVEGNKVYGTVISGGGEYLLVSLPYDKGYRVTVNGIKVQPQRALTDMIAVPLSEGENRVEMNFIPQGLIPGIFISAVGMIVFVLYLIMRNKILQTEKFGGVLFKAQKISYVLILSLGCIVFAAVYIMPEVLCLIGNIT